MRSLLFVPADSERKIAKGLASAADALILDLEDSVGLPNKLTARRMCVEVLSSAKTNKKLFVRMNALDTPHALEDLAAVVRANPAGIMLPKCRGAADLRTVSDYLTALEARDSMPIGQTQILPIVTETGASMFGLGTYTSAGELACPRLCAMLWGGEDLAADLGAMVNRDAQGQYTPPYQLARTLCLMAATAASVIAVDAVYVDFRDATGLEAEAAEAQRQGYSAKAAIHPDQIEVINRVFTPSPESLEWANKVLAAFAANPGAGVVNMDGKMVDIPHFKAATRIVARSNAASGT
jgi:citrate lyase subunit beta/citryl-CoA lyase